MPPGLLVRLVSDSEGPEVSNGNYWQNRTVVNTCHRRLRSQIRPEDIGLHANAGSKHVRGG